MRNANIKRVREFCELSSLVDADTNEFYPMAYYECEDPAHGPKLTKKFTEWNLGTVEEWNTLMLKEMDWIVENKREVMKVLPVIERDWPSSCNMIRQMYNMK